MFKITKSHEIVAFPEELCESCDDKGRATSYCNECSANLCALCVDAHLKLKVDIPRRNCGVNLTFSSDNEGSRDYSDNIQTGA